MIQRIDYHKHFLKSYKRLSLKIQLKVDNIILVFAHNPYEPTLRNHELAGERAGCRSIDVTGDLRIIFRELSDGTYEVVQLLDIGTHNQLYG